MGRGRAAFLLLATLIVVGCEGSDLWARYQAERLEWRARRVVERIQVHPQLAGDADFDEASKAFRAIVDRFPSAVWGTPARLAHREAADVATIAGNALISMGRLEESQGRSAEALALYRRAESEWAALTGVRIQALVAQAAALERGGDSSAATPLYLRIATEFPLVDPRSGDAQRAVLDAPFRAAERLRAAGETGRADSLMEDAETRFAGEVLRRAGGPAAPELWTHLAQARRSHGRLDAALDALRHALSEPAAKARRGTLVLTLAEYCADGGRPDSALVYAGWGERFGLEIQAKAMMLEGRIWEAVDVDSALAAYERFIDTHPRAGEMVLAAQFRRAELQERIGRWDQARGGFRAVAASSATHELALEASERIVRHHVRLGEMDLARLEARRALETFDRLLTIVQDEATLLRIRQARARLLVQVGRWDDAYAALLDLWKRYGDMDAGVNAGFRAAEVAERELRDRERARQVYQELASRSPTSTDQRRARQELERLRRERG